MNREEVYSFDELNPEKDGDIQIVRPYLYSGPQEQLSKPYTRKIEYREGGAD